MPRPSHQERVLHAILTLREGATTAALARHFGRSVQTLHEQVLALRTAGLIDTLGARGPHVLTDAGRARLGLAPRGVPIVGEIAAGQPVLADQVVEGYAHDLRDLLGLRDGDFLLRVRGDSMTGIGVFDGDLVAVHATSHVHDGDIAVVTLPGEGVATLKRLYRRGEQVVLASENPAYAPMTYPARDVTVQGRYAGHVAMTRPRRATPPGTGEQDA